MSEESFYPKFISRVEELQIQRELDEVIDDHQSRAVLLYGLGGVGKTSLVRQMAQASSDARVTWLEPVDVDDPEFWLMSNLERRVADRLDPSNIYFTQYRAQLSRLPSYTRMDISHETVVSYLGRIKEIFVSCYNHYLEAEQKTVVMVFDTVETIRGTNLLLTLIQWIKTLPTSTLFILSGRPFTRDRQDLQDPIRTELENPYHGIPVTTIEIGGLALDAAYRFIESNQISDDLVGHEKDKLILLTRGHPQWLAFMMDYVRGVGIPEEAELRSFDYIERHLPYGRDMTSEGRKLHEAFLRRLVAPYRESDFWHEAIKRLALVQQPITKHVWRVLMSDRAFLDDITNLDDAWLQLLNTLWVRPRGNGRYVTVHDTMAAELAQRLFPMHDQDQQWRHQIWRRMLEIYGGLVAEGEGELIPELIALDEQLKHFDVARPNESPVFSQAESEIVNHSVRLDARKRELDQLKVARWYYLFLSDFERGCRELMRGFQQAEQQNDIYFQDLLAFYMQRFLPGGTPSDAFNDVIRMKLDEFRDWLLNERPDYYIGIGVMMAEYLLDSAQPDAALRLLDELPGEIAESGTRCRINMLRGTACMHIPGSVKDGLPHFNQALNEAEALVSADRYRFIAEAFKERGFYFTHTGQWQEADLNYRRAWNTLLQTLSSQSSDPDRQELASIQTNWAYVKGLRGGYREGQELVESAITIRHRLGNLVDEGMSWSVCGEVYRYARRFEKAWAAYATAEQLLQSRRHWSQLGLIYQEQAICLYQALQDDIRLTADPISDAKKLIQEALDICIGHSIRSYPSALNRAGRIFGHDNPEKGLGYLSEGIKEARRLSDGWFWFANLIEYVELSYSAWRLTSEYSYRANIADMTEEIQQAGYEYEFPNLTGRWCLLQGQLAIYDYLETGREDMLDTALESYKSGFAFVAMPNIGSSGADLLPAAFKVFRQYFSLLRDDIQADWQAELRAAWSDLDDRSTLLLTHLEELY